MTMESFKFQILQENFAFLCVPLTSRFSNFGGRCHLLGVRENEKVFFFPPTVCKQKLRNMFAFGFDDLNQQSSTFSLGAVSCLTRPTFYQAGSKSTHCRGFLNKRG